MAAGKGRGGYKRSYDKKMGDVLDRKRERMIAQGKSRQQVDRAVEKTRTKRTPQVQERTHRQLEDVLRRWGGPSGDLTGFGYGEHTFAGSPRGIAPDVQALLDGSGRGMPAPGPERGTPENPFPGELPQMGTPENPGGQPPLQDFGPPGGGVGTGWWQGDPTMDIPPASYPGGGGFPQMGTPEAPGFDYAGGDPYGGWYGQPPGGGGVGTGWWQGDGGFGGLSGGPTMGGTPGVGTGLWTGGDESGNYRGGDLQQGWIDRRFDDGAPGTPQLKTPPPISGLPGGPMPKPGFPGMGGKPPQMGTPENPMGGIPGEPMPRPGPGYDPGMPKPGGPGEPTPRPGPGYTPGPSKPGGPGEPTPRPGPGYKPGMPPTKEKPPQYGTRLNSLKQRMAGRR